MLLLRLLWLLLLMELEAIRAWLLLLLLLVMVIDHHTCLLLMRRMRR